MIRRIRQLAAGLLALTLAAGLTVGVPAGLVTFVGWPLPTAWPSLDQLTRLGQTGVSDTTVIKLLAVIVWIAWAQLTLALVSEASARIRGRATRALRMLPGLQPLAARLVAAIALLAATTVPPRPAGAELDTVAATVVAAPVTDLADATADGSPMPVRAELDTPTTTIATGPRESWWRLAETHLGDGMRWREIRDLNLDRTVAHGTTITTDTDHLEAGWQLLVPATDRSATADTHRTSDQAKDADEQVGEWHVQPGDHFWGIAEHTLMQAWGRPPTDSEIVGYWRQLIDANTDRLLPPGDPDLIYPDQRFVTPPPPPDPTTPGNGQPPHEPDDAATDLEQAEPPAASSEHRPSHETPTGHDSWRAAIEGRTPQTEADSEIEHRGDGWRTSIEGPDVPPADEQAVYDDEGEPRTAFGVPVGLTAGVAATGLAAAGILATVRWRRRTALAHRAPGLRLPTPLPDSETQVAKLSAAEPSKEALEDLAALLTSIPPDVHPVVVTTTDDGEVTLLFDEHGDLPQPPAPWTMADDGVDGPVGWRATIGDAGPERSVGLPLLVTLGRTHTPTTLLANIAAMGTLAIDGPDPSARRCLHAATVEVATSRIAVPVEVVVAGDRRLARFEGVRHTDNLVDEIGLALEEIDQDIVPDDRTPRLLVCHPDTTPPEVPDELRGQVGVVTATDPAAAPWLLEVDERHVGRLRLPDGGTVELTLPDLDPTLIDDELDRLDQHPAGVRPQPTAAGLPAAPTPSSNGQVKPGRRRVTDPAWCDVKVLGPIKVVRNGASVEGLGRRTLEVLAYLATNRERGVTKGELDDAIWQGHAAKPHSQRVTAALTKLRSALGDGPDGQPLLPRRVGTGPIRLSEHVSCDVDRVLAHLALAKDLPAELRLQELAAALELVRGQPFHDLPVSWASSTTEHLIVQLQEAALEIARPHREAGNYDAADTAIRHGLLLHDPNDALYLERAQLAKARGHPEQVSRIWEQLRQRHADDADTAGVISAPAGEIELAFRELIDTL